MPPRRSDQDYVPFDGDGRTKVQPIDPLEGTQPIVVTNAQARKIVDLFDREGQSNHSGRGGVMWVVTAWCREHDVPYEVERIPPHGPVLGYQVRRCNSGIRSETGGAQVR